MTLRIARELRVAVVAVAVATAACTSPSPKISQDAPGASATALASVRASASASAPPAAATAPARPADEEAVRVVLAGSDTDVLSVIRTERLRAKAAGRVLVVYAGAGWCEPCRRFKSAIDTGSLDAKLSRTTLLVFDADRDTERLASAGYAFRFIPYVALPGADGHPSDALEARSKGSESWRVLIARLEAWQSKGH